MSTELQEGQTIAIQMTVDDTMTAARFAEAAAEAYPSVLATPILVAEMERACAAIMTAVLLPGQLSVAANVEISHQAPTPLGAQVTTHARFLHKAGPLFWFEVWAEDPGGIIGRGKHARAIVDRTSIESRATKRAVLRVGVD